MIKIRSERETDYRRVEELTKKAFWNNHSPGCDEHYLAHIMRTHPDFIPELDLVLELDGTVIASIMYTRSRLIDAQGNTKFVLTFGPISVLPEYQRRGYGKMLQINSFEKALKLGYDAIVIYGNPENYVSSGFKSGKKFNVGIKGGKYPVALLVRELKEGTLKGSIWTYVESTVYDVDQDKAEEFDKDFEPMEKGYQPSQELYYIYSRSQILF